MFLQDFPVRLLWLNPNLVHAALHCGGVRVGITRMALATMHVRIDTHRC